MCLARRFPEEAAEDLRLHTKGVHEGRFIYAIESGLAVYDAKLKGFGPLGEQGFINCVGIFDEFDAAHAENQLYGIDNMIRDFYQVCREREWTYR